MVVWSSARVLHPQCSALSRWPEQCPPPPIQGVPNHRIVAVRLAWQKFAPSRSLFQILVSYRRLGSAESKWHHINTTPRAPISSSVMVLSATAQTAIAKSRLLKARKIQQLQSQKRVSQAQAESKRHGCPPSGWWSAQPVYPSTEWQNYFRQIAIVTLCTGVALL